MDQCTHEVRLQYWKNIILQKGLGVRHKKTSALPPLPPLPLRRARTSADLRGAQNIGREDVVFVLIC